MRVSVFPDITKTHNGKDIDILSVLDGIKTGHWSEKVLGYRKIKDTFGKKSDQAKEAKKALPYFTVSGTFSHRAEVGLVEHSGFIAIDIDGITDLQGVKEMVSSDPYSFCVFISCSGDGLCLIVRIDPKTHKDAYRGLDEYYMKCYGLDVDYLADYSRARFVSFDSELYLNQDSELFTEVIPDPEKTPKVYTPSPVMTGKKSNEEVFEMLEGWMERDGMLWTPGNRHKFMHSLACKANRLGITQKEFESYVFTKYPHFSENPSNAIEWVYKKRKNEHGRDERFTQKRAKVIEEDTQLSPEQIDEFLTGRVADYTHPVPRPPAIVSVQGHTICTAGNPTGITGPEKSGKSGVLSAIIAGSIPHGSQRDLLGFDVRPNGEGFLLLQVDTEQSRYNWDRNYRNAVRRSESSVAPAWYKSIWLKGLGPAKIKSLTDEALKRYSDQFGGVHMILTDGIGDYVKDVNDAGECNAMMDIYMNWAEEYKVPILSVLHTNPGSDKERGHLGSQFRRKCESMLRVERDYNTGESLIKFKMARNAGDVPEIAFSWNKEKMYHGFLRFDDKGAISKENESDLLQSALDNYLPLGAMFTRVELERRLHQEHSERRSKEIVGKLIKKGMIEFGPSNQLQRCSDKQTPVPF